MLETLPKERSKEIFTRGTAGDGEDETRPKRSDRSPAQVTGDIFNVSAGFRKVDGASIVRQPEEVLAARQRLAVHLSVDVTAVTLLSS